MIKTTSPSLTSTKCKYMRKDTILPLLASLVPQPPVLEGHRDPTDRLWKIPSKQYYEPAPAPADKQQRYEVNSVYHQKYLMGLVTFLHAAAAAQLHPHGYPPLKTILCNMARTHYSTCQQTFTTIRSHHQRSPRPTKTEHPFHQSTNAIDC